MMLVMMYAQIEHERKMELIQLQIDVVEMEKLKKEELYNLQIEKARRDLMEVPQPAAYAFVAGSSNNIATFSYE